MKTTARGILYHHFWGEYSAELYLDFPSEWQAEDAQHYLICATELDWTQKNASVGIHVNTEQLNKIVELLVNKHGADRNKIASLATSVDHGEPFTCEFEVEHPAQLKLL